MGQVTDGGSDKARQMGEYVKRLEERDRKAREAKRNK